MWIDLRTVRKQGHPLATRFGKLEVTHKKYKVGQESGARK